MIHHRALVVPLLTLAAVSCGPRGSTSEITVIRLWAFGREGEEVQQLIPEFERQHPGIRVRVQQIPWIAAHEKLLTAYVGDATPDLAQIGNTWIPEFAALGALEPLDDWVNRSEVVDSADFFGGIWSTNTVGDTTFGVPWYVDTRVIFYRKDVLARAGYREMPKTWTGWRRAMEAVQRELGPGRYAIFLPTNEWAQPYVLGMQAGSTLLDSAGRRGVFSDSAFRRAFDFYVGLFRSGLAPTVGNVEIANVYQEFARGRFAMWITGPWNLGEFRKRLPPELQDDWATAPLPAPEGDSAGVSLAGGASLAMFRASRHKEAAWRLVEFLSSRPRQEKFFHLTGDLPSRIDAWQRTGLSEDPKARAFWIQLHRVQPIPKVPEVELIATRVFESAEQVIRGRRPTGQALEALDRDVDRILEKRRWILDRQARP
ncbi:MAG TPA: sugar ABC transporter substrate-binding protein [Gemmatimonadales bacterium]|jgi:multiple sugar transport system substrate-binding protein